MHELEKVRKQLEVEKMELQSALEEAEVGWGERAAVQASGLQKVLGSIPVLICLSSFCFHCFTLHAQNSDLPIVGTIKHLWEDRGKGVTHVPLYNILLFRLSII